MRAYSARGKHFSKGTSLQNKTPDIAIAITTYKRVDLLRKLLDSICALETQPAAVILVDNDADPEVQDLAEEYGVSKYIPMSENTGGAGGFSRGIEEAWLEGHTWIWVMDDDVEVLPGAIERMSKWLDETETELENGVPLSDVTGVYQGFRKNFDDSFFYWQYHFLEQLGIPNPLAPSAFTEGETFRLMNTACFEGSIIHRDVVEAIGLPDARFFIYWDDTVYGYLASKVTQLKLVNDYILKRTRPLKNVKIGKVRKLNSTSDLSRYYIMRNRGHIAHYLMENDEYNPVVFGFGTALTFGKEVIRLFVNNSVRTGFPKLVSGMRDAKVIRRDKTWSPYSDIKKLS